MKASQDASDCVLIIKNACFLLINIYSFCEYSIFFKHETRDFSREETRRNVFIYFMLNAMPTVILHRAKFCNSVTMVINKGQLF